MESKKRGLGICNLLVILMFILMTVNLAIAVTTPEGPTTFTINRASRRAPAAVVSKNAYAGNVSEVILTGQTVTQTWAGYYGNVTGLITLDDVDNFTMYDWSLASPRGEVYATYAATVDWTTGNVRCWNWTAAAAEDLSITEFEGGSSAPVYAGLGLTDADIDGVNETFSIYGAKNHSDFFVGGQLINGTQGTDPANHLGPCSRAKLYNGSSVTGNPELAPYQEVLLYENTSKSVIYTSILRNNEFGFNNQTWDFELIVGENGHNGNIAVTAYYFYVELE